MNSPYNPGMSTLMPVNRFALKEWAVVCAALVVGRQTVLLRKGGIAEGAEGFRPEHDQFWLMPTRFHQSAEELTPAGADLLPEVEALQPVEGVIRLELYARIEGVFRVEAVVGVIRARGPAYSSRPETMQDRFRYRTPGLVGSAGARVPPDRSIRTDRVAPPCRMQELGRSSQQAADEQPRTSADGQ